MEKYMWRVVNKRPRLWKWDSSYISNSIIFVVLFCLHLNIQADALQSSRVLNRIVKQFFEFSWKQSYSLWTNSWKHCRSQSQSTAIRLSARSFICMSLGRFHGLSKCLKHQHVCNLNAYDYRNQTFCSMIDHWLVFASCVRCPLVSKDPDCIICRCSN